jgi:glycosyltransferase involved in cell wall biosynthesis
MNKPFVSVIIPVLNNAESLQYCLEALENQTYPKGLYDVVVIDNGSEENIDELVQSCIHSKITYESKPGPYAARNKGLSIANGEVIAFTDSDCRPLPDWIENGVANLLEFPNCALVAGKIEISFKDPLKPTAIELLESIGSLKQKDNVDNDNYGATANLFTFRKVIDHVGTFNEKLKSAGDIEWGQRAYSSGYKLIYADDTIVTHTARHSFGQFYKRQIRCVGGLHDLKKVTKKYAYFFLMKDLLRDLLPPVISIIRISSDDEFKRIKGMLQKCKVISVFIVARYLCLLESIRLMLGGTSRR